MLVVVPRISFVIALAVAALFAVLLLLSSPPPASAGDKDCADFKNQKKAQKFFKKHNPKKDPHYLDADNDGVACEELSCPCKGKGGFLFAAPWVDGGRERLVTVTL